jgi:hypothetical protein
MRDCWFQHDETTAHTADSTTTFLQEIFAKRIVGRGVWPPRSPDLIPIDFFVLVFLKERVYSNNSRSLGELKHNVEQSVANTDPETLGNVARNTLERVDACLREGG